MSTNVNDPTVQKVRELIRKHLLSMRQDDQGGYCGYLGDGKWNFVWTTLPFTTGDELNLLFEFAGVVPEVIVPLGTCRTCGHGEVVNGIRGKRGHRPPCVRCLRPKHDLWVPIGPEEERSR